jgi:hypothetical protein
MTRSEADGVLRDIEGILQQISRYHQLSEEYTGLSQLRAQCLYYSRVA